MANTPTVHDPAQLRTELCKARRLIDEQRCLLLRLMPDGDMPDWVRSDLVPLYKELIDDRQAHRNSCKKAQLAFGAHYREQLAELEKWMESKGVRPSLDAVKAQLHHLIDDIDKADPNDTNLF